MLNAGYEKQKQHLSPLTGVCLNPEDFVGFVQYFFPVKDKLPGGQYLHLILNPTTTVCLFTCLSLRMFFKPQHLFQSLSLNL